MNWNEFFQMGGYAFYVWTAWGLTTIVLFCLWLHPKLARAKIVREINRQIIRESKFNQN